MEIRNLKLGDEGGLAELLKQFWDVHEHLDPLLEHSRKISMKTHLKDARKSIEERRKDKFILVAVKNKKIVGYADFRIKTNGEDFKIKKYGYLDSVVTHQGYRKQGIARALTKEAIKLLKKYKINYIRAKVNLSNKTALKAWQKIGLKPADVTMAMMLK